MEFCRNPSLHCISQTRHCSHSNGWQSFKSCGPCFSMLFIKRGHGINVLLERGFRLRFPVRYIININCPEHIHRLAALASGPCMETGEWALAWRKWECEERGDVISLYVPFYFVPNQEGDLTGHLGHIQYLHNCDYRMEWHVYFQSHSAIKEGRLHP